MLTKAKIAAIHSYGYVAVRTLANGQLWPDAKTFDHTPGLSQAKADRLDERSPHFALDNPVTAIRKAKVEVYEW